MNSSPERPSGLILQAFPERPLDLTLQSEARPLTNRSRLLRRYIFRRGGREAFVVGESFEVTYTITNIDNDQFHGGVLVIEIDWPNGQREESPYQVPMLTPGEPWSTTLTHRGVLTKRLVRLRSISSQAIGI